MSVETNPELPSQFQPGELSVEGAAESLRSTEWGEMLSPELLLALARHFRVYHVPRGEVLCWEGDPGLFMGVLVRGHLKVSKRDFYGTERTFGGVEPGDTFGEMSFLDGHVRSASLRASEDSELLLLTKGSYGGLVSDEPRLAVSLLEELCRVLSARVRRLTDRTVQQLL